MGWFDAWSNSPSEAWLARQRQGMVDEQIRRRGIRDARVLDAMERVKRHCFVPATLHHEAYTDKPLGIGREQTISQPYIVALMSELADLAPNDRVLEVGTGSGYQTAVLAELADEVYTIERIESLMTQARRTLDQQGYRNIRYQLGDGFAGWPDAAPFQAIVVTAAPPTIPETLRAQLANGGRLVLPVGEANQDLFVLTRNGDTWSQRKVIPVRFVPMLSGAPGQN